MQRVKLGSSRVPVASLESVHGGFALQFYPIRHPSGRLGCASAANFFIKTEKNQGRARNKVSLSESRRRIEAACQGAAGTRMGLHPRSPSSSVSPMTTLAPCQRRRSSCEPGVAGVDSRKVCCGQRIPIALLFGTGYDRCEGHGRASPSTPGGSPSREVAPYKCSGVTLGFGRWPRLLVSFSSGTA
jgi:hypothetical protein